MFSQTRQDTLDYVGVENLTIYKYLDAINMGIVFWIWEGLGDTLSRCSLLCLWIADKGEPSTYGLYLQLPPRLLPPDVLLPQGGLEEQGQRGGVGCA